MSITRSALNLALLLSATTAFSQVVTLQEFESDPGTTGSAFGSAVAATAKYLYASAPEFDRGGQQDSGAVFSYDLKTLNQFFRLLTPTTFKQQEGSRLASTKSEVLIGYPSKYINSAAAAGEVVYYNEKKQIPTIFTNPDAVQNDRFGDALGMNTKLLVIGAPGDQDGPQLLRTGGAFAIVKKLPANIIRLPLPQFVAGDETGAAVAVSTKFIAVGAPGANDSGTTQGVVHIYDAKTLARIRTIGKAGVPSEGARFGASLVFAGTSLFVGAPEEGAGVGKVYQIELKTFESIGTISTNSPQQGGNFGAVLAGDKKYLAVGSPAHNQLAVDGGLVEIFDVKTGSYVRTMGSDSPEAGEHFGAALAMLKGEKVAIGAPATDSLTNDGHVYVLPVIPTAP